MCNVALVYRYCELSFTLFRICIISHLWHKAYSIMQGMVFCQTSPLHHQFRNYVILMFIDLFLIFSIKEYINSPQPPVPSEKQVGNCRLFCLPSIEVNLMIALILESSLSVVAEPENSNVLMRLSARDMLLCYYSQFNANTLHTVCSGFEC